jgi:agmatine/peptidylarginine deiminase
MSYLFQIIVLTLFSINTLAQAPLPHEPSPEILKQISEHNLKQSLIDSSSPQETFSRNAQVRPFAEYEKTGYIFFNDDDFYGYAKEIKETIAKNLPQDVTLVVYTTSTSASYLDEIKQNYSQFIDPTRLIVLNVPRSGSNNFWSRDNLPIPVWTEGSLTLVDAQYYYNFEPDDFIASLFESLITHHKYFYEGGNFMANSRGECLVVNRKRSYPGGFSDTAAIPDAIFKNQYGCNKLTRLKHLKGIGHADEVVKFMSDDIIVTDTPAYAEILKDQGYQVYMLPEALRDYETYANSLLVNDVLFVPSFGEVGDQKAVDVFKSLNLGLKIVSIPTRSLATGGQGGIHCVTMNYPNVPIHQIISNLR